MEKYNKNIRKTANLWAKDLNISIINYSKGFSNEQEFLGLQLTLEDFLLRISTCVIEKPEILSRRAANELKKKISKKLD